MIYTILRLIFRRKGEGFVYTQNTRKQEDHIMRRALPLEPCLRPGMIYWMNNTSVNVGTVGV